MTKQTYLISGQTAYVFDMCKSEDHDDQSEVTDFPVEIGVNITDHVRNKPRELVLEIVQSNFPVPNGPSVTIEGVSGIPRGAVLSEKGRAERAFADLIALKRNAAIVKVYSPLIQDLTNLFVKKSNQFKFFDKEYVITSVALRRDASSRTISSMSVHLKELVFVNSARAQILRFDEAKAEEEDKGKKEAKERLDKIKKESLTTAARADSERKGNAPQDPALLIPETEIPIPSP